MDSKFQTELYDGFFSQHLLFDLVIKIICCIVTLVIYNRPSCRIDKPFDSLVDCNKAVIDRSKVKEDAILCQLHGRKTTVFINSRLIEAIQRSESLDLYHTFAPSGFQRKWFGLLLSDQTLIHRPELRQTLLYAFTRLHKSLSCLLCCSNTTKAISGQLEDCIDMSVDGLRSLIWSFVCNLLFFNHPEFSLEQSSTQKFIRDWQRCVQKIRKLHFSGPDSKPAWWQLQRSPTVDDIALQRLLQQLDFLFTPLIDFYQAQMESEKATLLSNMLLQLLTIRQAIDSGRLGDQMMTFLSPVTINHLMCELSFLLTDELVAVICHAIDLLKPPPPPVSSNLQVKQTDKGDESVDKIRLMKSDQPLQNQDHCITNCPRQLTRLVDTVQEAVKLADPGWSTERLRRVARDTRIGAYDCVEDELVWWPSLGDSFDSRAHVVCIPMGLIAELSQILLGQLLRLGWKASQRGADVNDGNVVLMRRGRSDDSCPEQEDGDWLIT